MPCAELLTDWFLLRYSDLHRKKEATPMARLRKFDIDEAMKTVGNALWKSGYAAVFSTVDDAPWHWRPGDRRC